MDKITTLKSLEAARKAHEFQMQKIKTTIYGGEIEDLEISSKLECKLGRWLHIEDGFMRDILGSLFFDNIDKIHIKWHNEHSVIYKILINKEEKKGLLSKILQRPRVSAMDLDKVKLYYSELEITTKMLLKALDSAQRRLGALPESMYVK